MGDGPAAAARRLTAPNPQRSRGAEPPRISREAADRGGSRRWFASTETHLLRIYGSESTQPASTENRRAFFRSTDYSLPNPVDRFAADEVPVTSSAD
jgi:hypothetical protein